MNLQTLTHQKRRDMDFTDRPTKTWIQPGYIWLVNARSQNIPTSALILKAKALFLTKGLECNYFHASDG